MYIFQHLFFSDFANMAQTVIFKNLCIYLFVYLFIVFYDIYDSLQCMIYDKKKNSH